MFILSTKLFRRFNRLKSFQYKYSYLQLSMVINSLTDSRKVDDLLSRLDCCAICSTIEELKTTGAQLGGRGEGPDCVILGINFPFKM